VHCRCRFAGREKCCRDEFCYIEVFSISDRTGTLTEIPINAKQAHGKGNPLKILVIEDDPIAPEAHEIDAQRGRT
jgi:hypothetical protein